MTAMLAPNVGFGLRVHPEDFCRAHPDVLTIAGRQPCAGGQTAVHHCTERGYQMTSTAPTQTHLHGQTTAQSAMPSARVLVGTAVAYAVLFVGLFLTGGEGPDTNTAGAKIIADYDKTSLFVQLGGYAMVIAAAALIFFGAALRRALRREGADWLADAAFGGIIVMGVTLVGFAVTTFAMYDAVSTGNASVAQSINILDHANFVPAMLGLCCTLLATGLCGMRTGALPKWLSIVSIVLGVASPLGPAAFAPFALFPIWVVVTGAVTARRLSSAKAL
jgi:hypothetical protein